MQDGKMKPKYSFFKNFAYAREGFREVLQKEKSFRLQILFFVIFSFVALILPFEPGVKIALIALQLLPVMTELINSAIERTVDLVTQEYNELAKYAKDAAAAAVMVSIVITVLGWVAALSVFFT